MIISNCIKGDVRIYRTSEEVLIRTTKEQKVLGAMGEVSMVIDPETKQPISLDEARRKGILDEASGLYRDPRTGKFAKNMYQICLKRGPFQFERKLKS